jgi:peptidoglycan/LPS O-acetylase OafA/YrhL
MSKENQRIPASRGRLHHLDALRGLAALSVVAGHDAAIVPAFESWTPLLGRPAVTFFFLLSGYVLGKSLSGSGSNRLIEWFCYCIRRVFRLYPAIFATLVVAAILAQFYVIPGQSSDLAGWFSKAITKATTIHGLHDYLGSFRLYYLRLDPPLWTIQIEFVCSFLLPFLVWPAQKNVVLRWVTLVLLGFIKLYRPNWAGMASYLFEFYLGYIAWTLAPKIASISPHGSKYLTLLVLFATLGWLWFCDRSGVGMVSIAWLASFLAFAGPCRWERFKEVLNIRPLQFLGRISYSLYLIHLPILMICWSILIGRRDIVNGDAQQVAILLLIMLPISFLISALMECFVERPFNELGHQTSKSVNNLLNPGR